MQQTLTNSILRETLLNQKDINSLKQQRGSFKGSSKKELERQMSDALSKQPVPDGHYRSVPPPTNQLAMHGYPDHYLRTSSWHPRLEWASSLPLFSRLFRCLNCGYINGKMRLVCRRCRCLRFKHPDPKLIKAVRRTCLRTCFFWN